MTILRTLAIAVFLSSISITTALCDVQDMLQQTYENMMRAVGSKNVDAYMSYFDPGVVYVDLDGLQYSYGQIRAEKARSFAKLRKFTASVYLENIHGEGGKLMVRARRGILAEFAGSDSLFSPPSSEVSDDVWEKKNGAWKLVYSKRVSPEAPLPQTDGDSGDDAKKQKVRALCLQLCEQNSLSCSFFRDKYSCITNRAICDMQCKK